MIVLEKYQEKNIEFGPNQNLEIVLAGIGAKIGIGGVWEGKAEEKLEGVLRVVHKAPETISKVNIRGVLYDKSQANFDGLIRIEKGAKNADGYLRADFLLFDEAKARPLPYLEILENEVKAGHAATVTRVDEEQIFYLMSRGLTRTEAEKMLIEGFLGKTLKAKRLMTNAKQQRLFQV